MQHWLQQAGLITLGMAFKFASSVPCLGCVEGVACGLCLGASYELGQRCRLVHKQAEQNLFQVLADERS